MKIKYLGTAAAEGVPALFCECENCVRSRRLGGRNIRTRSQAIVDDTLLIDFPADTYMHYLKENFPLNRVKSCIITHSHMDHLYPEDVVMRRSPFGYHPSCAEPLTFYSCKSGFEMISAALEKDGYCENDVKICEINPFSVFETDGYRITPIKAVHDEKSDPVVFAIEKDGKSLLYFNDSGEPCEESLECIKSFTDRPFGLVSLDCTSGNNANDEYYAHMSLERCAAVRDCFIDIGAANENTIFVLNHFSHNGKDVVYDDFVKIAEKEKFLVSYDGMELEF